MVFAGLNGPVTISGVAFLFLSAIGFIGAYLYGRASPSFRWRDYVALLSVPVLLVFGTTNRSVMYGTNGYYVYELELENAPALSARG